MDRFCPYFYVRSPYVSCPVRTNRSVLRYSPLCSIPFQPSATTSMLQLYPCCT